MLVVSAVSISALLDWMKCGKLQAATAVTFRDSPDKSDFYNCPFNAAHGMPLF